VKENSNLDGGFFFFIKQYKHIFVNDLCVYNMMYVQSLQVRDVSKNNKKTHPYVNGINPPSDITQVNFDCFFFFYVFCNGITCNDYYIAAEWKKKKSTKQLKAQKQFLDKVFNDTTKTFISGYVLIIYYFVKDWRQANAYPDCAAKT
jgi:hypothetical protein